MTNENKISNEPQMSVTTPPNPQQNQSPKPVNDKPSEQQK